MRYLVFRSNFVYFAIGCVALRWGQRQVGAQSHQDHEVHPRHTGNENSFQGGQRSHLYTVGASLAAHLTSSDLLASLDED